MQEIHLQLLHALAADPRLTQRELAAALGISLGKANYCLKALVTQGWVRTGAVRGRDGTAVAGYVLTAAGQGAKSRLSAAFLKRKLRQQARLQREIASLQREVGRLGESGS